MTTADLTIEVLRQIRDGVTLVAERVDHLEERLSNEIDGLRTEVAGTNERLDRVEVRLGRVEQGLNDLGGFMRTIAGDQARHERWLTQHVEREIGELKARVARLEATGEPAGEPR